MPNPNSIFRNFVIDGVPSSGAHRPSKSEIRAWAAEVDGAALLACFNALADDLSARTVPDPGIRIEPPGGAAVAFLPRPQAVAHYGPGGVKFDRSTVDWAFDYYAAALSASECYVDLINGSNGAAGTYAAPFLTIEHAVRNTTFSFIKVKCNGGVAKPFVTLPSDTGSGKLKIITLLDGNRLRWAFDGPALSGLTWASAANGFWKATLTGQGAYSPPHHILYADGLGGRWLPQESRLTLLSGTSPSSHGAATQGFIVDFTGANRDVYVKLPGGLNVEANKAYLRALFYGTNYQTSLLNQGFRTILDGNHVFDGVGILNGSPSNATYKGTIVGRDVQILCSADMGWKSYGGIALAERMRNVLPQYDSFNYDVSPDGTKCVAMEIDTIAGGAGDVAAFGTPAQLNRNASSAHGGANIVRAGCLYDETQGPVVNDTTTDGQTGDISWNLGCVMRESLAGTEASIQCSGGTTGSRRMYNHGCATRISDRSIYVTGAGATAKNFANLLHTAATSDTGGVLVDPYDPGAP